MSGSLNKVTLIGHLGPDPEIVTLSSGKPVAKFSLATNDRWRDKRTGEVVENVEWHRVVVYNEGLVKIVEQYLHRGSQVYVEGTLRTRSWEKTPGDKRYATEVVLTGYGCAITMLGAPGDRGSGGHQPPNDPNDTNTAKPQQTLAQELDDEIPF